LRKGLLHWLKRRKNDGRIVTSPFKLEYILGSRGEERRREKEGKSKNGPTKGEHGFLRRRNPVETSIRYSKVTGAVGGSDNLVLREEEGD